MSRGAGAPLGMRPANTAERRQCDGQYGPDTTEALTV